MSYILEALRRADADRQRGAVPGLHAQPPAAPRGDTPADGPARIGRTGVAVLLGCALVLALAAAWWLGRGAGVGPALPTPPAPAVAQPPPTPAATALAGPTAAEAASATAPAPALPPTLVPAPAVALASPVVAAAAAASVTTATGTATAPIRPAMASAPTQPAAAPAAAASAPGPPIRWAALPESVRNGLPALALSGAVHAEQPSQRLLIVNGQVAREGDELSPGLRLEQIRPRSAVLRWRGQRFEMPL